MQIPYTYLKSDNTEVNAFRVGVDIAPQWIIDMNNNKTVEFLGNFEKMAIKVNTKIAHHGDYIINTNDKLSILDAEKFEKTYTPKMITSEE